MKALWCPLSLHRGCFKGLNWGVRLADGDTGSAFSSLTLRTFPGVVPVAFLGNGLLITGDFGTDTGESSLILKDVVLRSDLPFPGLD
jgi:hypothetical protein